MIIRRTPRILRCPFIWGDMMICANCGTDNVAEANYCKYCGKQYPGRAVEIHKAKKMVESGESKLRIAFIIAVIYGIFYLLTEFFSS